MLFRIKWEDEVDYDLLSKIIDFNIEDKKKPPKILAIVIRNFIVNQSIKPMMAFSFSISKI